MSYRCDFCPFAFRTLQEKDEHSMSHFKRETCRKCDQNLIRIGGNYYVLHSAITCNDRSTPKHCIEPPKPQNYTPIPPKPANYSPIPPKPANYSAMRHQSSHVKTPVVAAPDPLNHKQGEEHKFACEVCGKKFKQPNQLVSKTNQKCITTFSFKNEKYMPMNLA